MGRSKKEEYLPIVSACVEHDMKKYLEEKAEKEKPKTTVSKLIYLAIEEKYRGLIKNGSESGEKNSSL